MKELELVFPSVRERLTLVRFYHVRHLKGFALFLPPILLNPLPALPPSRRPQRRWIDQKAKQPEPVSSGLCHGG